MKTWIMCSFLSAVLLSTISESLLIKPEKREEARVRSHLPLCHAYEGCGHSICTGKTRRCVRKQGDCTCPGGTKCLLTHSEPDGQGGSTYYYGCLEMEPFD